MGGPVFCIHTPVCGLYTSIGFIPRPPSKYANPFTITKHASWRFDIVAFGFTSIHCPLRIEGNIGADVICFVGTFVGLLVGFRDVGDFVDGVCTGVVGKGSFGVDIGAAGAGGLTGKSNTGVGILTGRGASEVGTGAVVGIVFGALVRPNNNAQKEVKTLQILENNTMLNGKLWFLLNCNDIPRLVVGSLLCLKSLLFVAHGGSLGV
jgi:hypothetical protein